VLLVVLMMAKGVIVVNRQLQLVGTFKLRCISHFALLNEGRVIMDYLVRDGLAIFLLYNCTLKNRLKRSKTLIEHNVLTCSILSSFQCDKSFFLTMKL
jgi:hypothetical protein